MPYLFALLLLANIGALGYFLFIHDSNTDAPSIVEAKSQLTKTVDITNPNK